MPRVVYVPELGRAFSFRDDASSEDISAYLESNFKLPPTTQEAVPPPAEDGPGAFGAGVYGGIAALQAAGGKAAQGIGLEDFSKYLFEASRANQAYAEKYQPEVADISQIGGVGDLLSYAGSAAAQSAPETAIGIGGAYAGGAAGAAIGSVVPIVGTAAGGIIGGLIGGAMAGLPFFVGRNLQRQAEEQDKTLEETSGLAASAGAIAQAPLDAAFDVLIARKFPGGGAVLDEARRGFFREVASTAGRGAATEALTEPAQQAIELAQANPEKLLEFGPDVQFELLNAAATGSLVGGVLGGGAASVEPIARKIAEAPKRQLLRDLENEAIANQAIVDQGELVRAAEELRQYNVEGPVTIGEADIEGMTGFTIKAPSGNMFGAFSTPEQAQQAIEIYKQRTGAKITATIEEAPEIDAEAEEADQVPAPQATVTPALEGTPEATVTTPEAITPEASPELTEEDFAPVVEPIPEEMPIGAIEMPVEEQRYIDAVEEAVPEAAPTPEVAPEPPKMELRPSATDQQLTDLKAELFGVPKNIKDMTPEERTLYETERDKRYPPVEVDVSYDAGMLKTPKTLTEVEQRSDARKYTPEYQAFMDGVYTELSNRLSNIAPDTVSLKLRDFVKGKANRLTRGGETPVQTPDGLKSIIELATGYVRPGITVEEMVNELVGTLNHEVIHALRTQGLLRPAEWQMLSRAAAKTKVPGKKYTYLDKAQAVYEPMGGIYTTEDAVIEEAVAEMYKDWVAGKNRKEAVPVAGLFNRITEFLRRIFRTLQNRKYEDVFKQISAGEMRTREGTPESRREGQRFSAVLVVHGGSDFDKIDKTRFGSGEPGGIRPLGNGLYGYVVTIDNPEDAKRAIEGAKNYAKKYGRGEKTIHVFSVPKTARIGYNGPVALEGFPDRQLGADGQAIAREDIDEYKKNSQLYAEKLPGGLIEMAILDPSIATRVGRFKVDTSVDEIYDILNDAAQGGNKREGEIRFSAAPALNSEEFKRWFKNSKVINRDGSPMVVYHGTQGFRGDQFSSDAERKNRSGNVSGFYFSSNKDRASGYTEDWRTGETPEGAAVMPGYMSLQNPFIMGRSRPNAKMAEAYKAELIKRNSHLSEKSSWFDAKVGEMMSSGKPSSSALNGDGDALQRVYKAGGFDGVIDGTEYVAFDPLQVKSIFNQFEEGAAEDTRFAAAPLPQNIAQANTTLFAPEPKEGFFQSMVQYFTGPGPQPKTLNTAYGQVDISKRKMQRVGARASAVDKNAFITELEKLANLKSTGNYERMLADYSATAALGWRRRSSHINASMLQRGKLTLDYARPGDIQSATMKVVDDPDSMVNIIKILMEPGPVDPVTNEQKDKREVFKSYAVAMRAKNKALLGIKTPNEVDQNYVNTVIPFTQQNYPEVVQAYEMYQRFNRNLLKTAKEAGLITDTELQNLTRNMDYYGFYREVFENVAAPGMPTKTASKFELRAMKGGEHGNLVGDPIYVMVHNAQFWVDSIAKNIAAQKSFKLAKDMGVARILGSTEKPDQARGEEEQVMFFRENGVQKRFAVSDPLLVMALGTDDRVDVGRFWQIAGMPTTVLRESVTRDPGFMVANLLRDTLSAWITSGEDITPFIGTIKGFAKAYKGSASFEALMGRGVVGSYDLAMKAPKELAADLRNRAMPKNILTLNGPEAATAVIGGLWNRLGALSEYSDAATRIAVYEAARAQGLSEAEATFRAIEIMDFSRRGGSQALSILTKVVPFLNARIQGMDVLYQAGKAAGKVLTGKAQGERETNLGKKFLVRGAMLAAISFALEMMNTDDEDYQQLDDYIKTGNLLIPLKYFGLEGQFLAIPKPFEAGLLFSTFPQEFYKSMSGDASTRSMVNLFISSVSSTFGVNPIPQAILPALEIITNHDFYTGLPLISEGKARLAPELQYNSGTSQLAMMLGDIPIWYDMTSGRFEGLSPIVIDQIIGGYGGPWGTYLAQAVGMAMEGAEVGPERLPRDITQLPVVRRFFMDAQVKNPKVVTQAYELFRLVDEANRSFSRLRQTGDAEAVMAYLEENKDVLSYKKYVFKLVDRLNKLSAHERQIERDQTMTREEKLEAMAKLREVRIRLASKVKEINAVLGR